VVAALGLIWCRWRINCHHQRGQSGTQGAARIGGLQQPDSVAAASEDFDRQGEEICQNSDDTQPLCAECAAAAVGGTIQGGDLQD